MNMWDARYSQHRDAYGRKPNDFLQGAAHHLAPESHVLCLAEGEGRNAVYLALQGHSVTAMDLSAVGMKRAEEWAAENGVALTTVCADLADFDMGVERWDAVVLIWVHLPPGLRREVLRRCVQALLPGGVLLLEAYTPKQVQYGTGGPPDPAFMANLDDLAADLEGLILLEAREVEREIHEGAMHNGWSAVVQVVGKKPDHISQ